MTFEEAIKMEEKRLKEINHDNKILYPYFSAGVYANQLQEGFKLFPKKQFLIIDSSDLFSDPQKVYDVVIDFLNLPKIKLKQFKKYKQTKYSKEIDKEIRDELIKKFKPHN